MSDQGVIVGCDARQEWLLPWWWDHYSRYNAFPVAFADFGMTEKAKAWVAERGDRLSITSSGVSLKHELPPATKKLWEEEFGKGIWHSRPAWFKKPYALLQCPFHRGIWIDLDCQIKGTLEPLFNVLNFGADIALVPEPDFVQNYARDKGFMLSEEVHYNAGVIVFRNNASILHQWALEAADHNEKHAGDQSALCKAIFKNRPSLIELPPEYNWFLGPNPEAVIYHFTGGTGKIEILKQTNPELLPVISEMQIMNKKKFTKLLIAVNSE